MPDDRRKRLKMFYVWPQWKDQDRISRECVWIDPETVIGFSMDWTCNLKVHVYGSPYPIVVGIGGDNPEQTLQGVCEALGYEWRPEFQESLEKR